LLHSGIQAPSGGVARYYNLETGKYKPVSTEITGYAASALVWLFQTIRDEEYLARARQTAHFLASVWDEGLQTFPFEHPSPSPESEHLAYFFDCGIVIRGLIAVWREIGDDHLLDIAVRAAHGMLAGFRATDGFHPIVALPSKAPVERATNWSRSPGCYQLKSARSWWDLSEITGDAALRDGYLEFADASIAAHRALLDGIICATEKMDRLHPACYFLEGLLPLLADRENPQVYIEYLACISKCLKTLEHGFVRSDVYAQLLRARLYAAAVIPVDESAGCAEAAAVGEFQVSSNDCRTNGGFHFGRRDRSLSPHINPVSTVFAIQALETWRQYRAGSKPPCQRLLI